MAYMYGYKPKVTGLAETDIEFFQQVPSILVNGIYEPDYSYALYINSNTQISTNNGTGQKFAIEDPIDFSVSSSLDPTEVSVASLSGGNPQFYLLKKTRKGFSGTIATQTFTISEPQEFLTLILEDTQIAGIIDVLDINGNKWYEVDYLGQDLIYDGLRNTNINSPNTYEDEDTPFILQTKQ